MMGGEEKKVPDGNDAGPSAGPSVGPSAGPSAAPTPAAPTPTPSTAAAEAERVRKANMNFRDKVVDGQYPTFAECWAAAEGPAEGSAADHFSCCESIGTPYPEYGETGWAYCNEHT